MHPSPNIFRSTVIGNEAKYRVNEKKCQGGIFVSEIEVLVKKTGGYMLCIRFQTV